MLFMFKLTPENTSRKVDSLGRIVIPAPIRNKLLIHPNDELEFFMLEYDGNHYICLSSNKAVDPRYSVAIDVLKELQIDIPKKLIDLTH